MGTASRPRNVTVFGLGHPSRPFSDISKVACDSDLTRIIPRRLNEVLSPVRVSSLEVSNPLARDKKDLRSLWVTVSYNFRPFCLTHKTTPGN